MAKNTQEAEVIVTLNGQAAKKAVAEMTAEFERLSKAALDAYKNGDDALGKKLDAQAQKLMKDIEITRRETKKFADVMNNINGASLKELRSAAKQLQSEINKLTPGTQAFIEKSKQLQQVNTRIRQLTNEFKGLVVEEKQAAFSVKGLADGFNKYFGMVTAGVAAITGLSMAFRKAAEDAAKLDDTYADVMKTTGLMHDEVADLDKELMKINTRTSREQLLLLARDAGKLGIQGKEDILGFVRAADQIQVALGEDLGEGAIKNLGKIADVFGLTKEMGIEKSLLSIASAVNALGQASTASEAYLVDFTQRLAGVGAMAGLSVQDILGFASGLDQSAMKVEMAATAFQKFLMKMYEEPAKFAGYAGMEVEAFTELLKTNANEAITVVMKAMNGQDGFAAMVPIFNEMGLDGARAVGVLSAMTKNLDAVTEAQALANEEFAKATSVTEEYNTKNNNLQANLEKARKEFHNASVELGQSLNPIMLKSTKATTYLIKALASYGKEIRNALVAIAALTVAIKAKTIATAAYNAVVKAGTVLQKTWQTLVWASRTAFFKLIGATEAATIAQSQLNAVMSASVFGVIALAVAGLTAAITHYVKKAKEANDVADKMKDIQERVNQEYSEGAGKVQALTNIVHNNNLELDQRRRALDDLKKIVPGYHADLTKEGQLINDNTEALKEYLKNLEKVTRAKILEEEYTKATEEVLKAEKELEDAKSKKVSALVDANGDTSTIKAFTMQSTAGAYSVSEITPYGHAVREETAATEALNTAREIQAEIMRRIEREQDNMVKRAGEGMSEMEKAISGVNSKYTELLETMERQYAGDDKRIEAETKRINAERQAELDAIRDKYAEKKTVEAAENAILTQAQFDFLQERYDKLTKKEKKMVDAGYASLSAEDSKALKARYDKLTAADRKLDDKRYQEQVKQLEQAQRAEQNLINQQFFAREITAEQHEKALRDITTKYLVEKLELAKANGKDITQIEASILGERMKNRKGDYDKELKQMEARQKEEEQALSLSLSAQEITEKEYRAKSLELKMRYLEEKLKLTLDAGEDETAVLQAIFDAQIEAEKAAYEEMKKLKEDAQKVIAGLDPSAARQSELKAELDKLEELHDAKLLSEEQYEEAVKKLRKKYADEDLQDQLGNIAGYIEKANKMMEGASNFVTQLKEYETQKLEAEYQAQLTAAGDNAEQREAIEAEYEQKKLDLQKKYADTEMVINIAKAIAAGALAAVEAFAAAGGNPVLGGIFAAIIAATTALEVATIVQQRNAIKNSSVSSSGSSTNIGSTDSTKTGNRVVTGYAEGGYTPCSASDRTEVGVVHANEYVAPAWMVRQNPVTFANLERYRLAGSHGRSGSAGRGFAEGGFTGETPITATVSHQDILRAIKEGAKEGVKEGLDGEYIHALVQYGDILIAGKKYDNFKKQTSR